MRSSRGGVGERRVDTVGLPVYVVSVSSQKPHGKTPPLYLAMWLESWGRGGCARRRVYREDVFRRLACVVAHVGAHARVLEENLDDVAAARVRGDMQRRVGALGALGVGVAPVAVQKHAHHVVLAALTRQPQRRDTQRALYTVRGPSAPGSGATGCKQVWQKNGEPKATQPELPREKLSAIKELAQLEPAVHDWQHLGHTQTASCPHPSSDCVGPESVELPNQDALAHDQRRPGGGEQQL